MAKLFAVIRREYLERVRTKWFIIVTLFGPIFFGTIMILPGYLSFRSMSEVKVQNIRILDATNAGLGARIALRLTPPSLQAAAPTSPIGVEVVMPGTLAALEEAAESAVLRKEIAGYLVVDSSTMAGASARYAGRNASSVGDTEQIEAAIRASLLTTRIEAAGIDPELAKSLTQVRVQLATERITDQGRGGSGLASAIFGFGIAFLLYMSIILYGQNILRGVLEEKTTRVAEVVVSSVSPDILLAGKVIGVGAVGLTQQLTWLVSGYLFWDQRSRIMTALGMPALPPISLPTLEPLVLVALVLFFLLGYTFYASLFAAVGAMVSNTEEATQASQPVMMMLIFSIIFVQPVMTNPTGRLAEVMSWLPFSSPIIMPMRMSATQVPTIEIIGSLLGVALACVVSIWVSARIYRVGLLMYGKRPSLKELVRWIRYA